MTPNPYESPIAVPLEAPQNKRSAWRTIGLLLLAGPGTIGSWLGLLYALFAWSTGVWNRCVSVGLIMAIVVVWAVVVGRIRVLRNVGAASLIAYATAVLLLFIVALGIIVAGANAFDKILPSSTNEYTRGTWILLAAAACGATFGLIGLSKGLWQERPMSMIVGGSCGLICLVYLMGIVASFVFAHGLFR